MAEVTSVFEDVPTVHQNSQESIRSELNIFTLPPTDVSAVQSSEFVPFYPRISVKDEFNPLEIVINSDSYIDLANSFLKISARIVQQNGNACSENDTCVPSSLFLHAMFKSCEIYLNGQLVSDASGYYPYVAYLNRLLTSSQDQKDGLLKDEFYYPNIIPDNYTNDAGFTQRLNMTKESGIFTMTGNVVANIMNQPRYLPGGCELRIVMKKSDPEFSLDCKDKTKAGFNGCPWKFSIEEAVFYAAKRVVLPKIVSMHRAELDKGNTMKYPCSEYIVKSFTIPQGLRQFTSDALVMGKIPKMLVMGVVTSKAFLGDLQKSPFNFVNADLREVSITYNGEPVEYRALPFYFKPTTAKGTDDILLPLRSLRKTAANDVLGNGISRDNYNKGTLKQKTIIKVNCPLIIMSFLFHQVTCSYVRNCFQIPVRLLLLIKREQSKWTLNWEQLQLKT